MKNLFISLQVSQHFKIVEAHCSMYSNIVTCSDNLKIKLVSSLIYSHQDKYLQESNS
jgi:hypothetical protein